MAVEIRLTADTPAELDTYQTALRTVLDLPAETGQDHDNRRGPDTRRYLNPTGVRTTTTSTTSGSDDAGRSPRAVAEDFKHSRDLPGEIGALTAADADLARQPWSPLQPGDVVLMHLAADQHSSAYGETFVAVDDDTDIAGNAMLRRVSRTPALDDGELEPEYLLRYDTDDGRWVLDSDFGDGLQPWRTNLALGGAQAGAEAQIWAAPFIRLVDDPDALGHLQWREHAGGLVPYFVPTAPPIEQLTAFYDLWFEASPGMLSVIRAGTVVHGRPATAAATAVAEGA